MRDWRLAITFLFSGKKQIHWKEKRCKKNNEKEKKNRMNPFFFLFSFLFRLPLTGGGGGCMRSAAVCRASYYYYFLLATIHHDYQCTDTDTLMRWHAWDPNDSSCCRAGFGCISPSDWSTALFYFLYRASSRLESPGCRGLYYFSSGLCPPGILSF